MAKNSDTGKPHVGLAYYIETGDNKIHYGNTDKHGLTQRIYSMNIKDTKVLYGSEAQAKIDEYTNQNNPNKQGEA